MMSRTGSKGFTLVEVLVATAVLALGVVFIYEALFTSLDTFNYYYHYFSIAPWADEKIWMSQDAVRRLGSAAQLADEGHLTVNNRPVQWGLTYESLDEAAGLYKINLLISWKQGKKEYKVKRTAYELFAQETQ
jgi:prepilin-type N-terminal cleavage/methylation domain-containing protein